MTEKPKIDDFLAEHPDKNNIIGKLKSGKSPTEISRYLQFKFAEYEHLHIDSKSLAKLAQKYAPPKPKQKQWFLIYVEGIAPVKAQFRVFAEDEEKAFETLERNPHLTQMDGRPHIDLKRINQRKISIKNLMTGMINWVRKF